MEIKLTEIKANPTQPRRGIDPDKLAELSASIREVGLLNPILVRPNGKDYEIVHGERRFKACESLGLETIRAEVRELSDEQAFLIALTENIQRHDLDPIEEAAAYQRMIADFGYTQAKVGEVVGKSQQLVADRLCLLNLSDPIQDMITARAVSPSVGRMLSRHDNTEEAEELAMEVADGNLTVRGLGQVLRGERPAAGSRIIVLTNADDPIETLNWCEMMFAKLKIEIDDYVKENHRQCAEYGYTSIGIPPEVFEELDEETALERFVEVCNYAKWGHELSNRFMDTWIRKLRAECQLHVLYKDDWGNTDPTVIKEIADSFRRYHPLLNFELEDLNAYLDYYFQDGHIYERELTLKDTVRFARRWSLPWFRKNEQRRLEQAM